MTEKFMQLLGVEMMMRGKEESRKAGKGKTIVVVIFIKTMALK